jgi:serine/threonine protein kinase/TolB-like protein/Tfp pilus assembly protein PilF
MKQEIRFCISSDGVQIAFATIGNGPVLVKAANWLSHLEYEWESPVWHHWIKELSRYHTLVRYDERGCGLSDWRVKDFSFNSWVKDLEAVVNTLNLDHFPLLGISQGGPVAISYAIMHPEKVSHLILYGAYAQGRILRNFSTHEAEQHRALTTLIKTGWGQDNPAFRHIFANLFMPDASSELLHSFTELQRISTSPENAARFHEEFGNIDVLKLLPEINIPTLVLHSGNDGRIPLEAGRQLAALIPNSKFVLLPSRNHILLENEPAWQRFLDEVYEFLEIKRETDMHLSVSMNNKISQTTKEIPEGQIVAHYRILNKLGEGGMGVVYKAEDTKLRRVVALKFLPYELTRDNDAKKRFVLEAQTASALDHPNICTIYEIDKTGEGQMYIAMAFYEGQTLKEKIERSPLKIEELIDIAIQVSEGLKRAHEAGMVHRDIKPGNIIVTPRGEVKILDFGLAKILSGQLKFTKTGTIAGTVYYMSPEQINGENIDNRTDIWSLGVVLYEIITGQLPFKGEYEQAIIYSILNEYQKPVKTFRNNIPVDLEKIIDKALTKNPSDRYRNMNDLLIDLKRLKERLLKGKTGDNENETLTIGKDYRRLSAIMFTDMVGYSALTQRNEELALELLKEHREILRPIFLKHNGKEIETAGDSFFVEFVSALDAAKCAVEIQKGLHERNQFVPPDRKILLRIGLHVGDVVHTDNHVHGDGVNLAARLEPLASPGCICVSEDVARQIQSKIDYPVLKVGKKKLKNIQLPMNVYKIVLPWEKKTSGSFVPTYRDSFLKNRSLIFAILILLFGAIGFFIFQNTKDGLVTGSRNRIAVLPFANISQGSEDDYFADGITEEIISNLAKISGLDVIARTSIIKYKNTELNVAQIGNELNVGTILEGSVRKAANKTRITVQLIDVPTQRHLWAEAYDRELKDIFAIQSDIAMKVAEGLKVQLLTHEKEQIGKIGTENTEAYRNYLLGNYYLNKRTGEAFNKGIEYFSKAIEFDPQFALAYSGLANCYTFIGGAAYGNISREEASAKANDAVLKALELDETLAEAHASLGYIKFRFDWNWDEAEKEFKRAIELKPGYAQAHEWYALFLSLIRKSDKALIEMKRAYELDPLSPSISTGVGRILHFAKRLDEAIVQTKKTIEMYPNYAEAHFALSMTYVSQRRIDEAMKELDKAIELSHGRLVMITTRGMIYGFSGKRKEALAILDELEKLSYPDPVSPWYIASIYLSVGDKDKFFEYAFKAYEQKDALMVYFQTIVVFDSTFGNDPRYHNILKKMGIEK